MHRVVRFAIFVKNIDEMPTFFIVLFILYLFGNIYIFLRGRKAFSSYSTGVKVLLSLLFWGGAFSFVSILVLRNTDLPDMFARTMYEVGTGWLVFTLYMVIGLAVFDLFKLFHKPCQYAFYLSLGTTLSLLAYGYYNYQHPDTRVVNIVINKSISGPEQSLRIVAVSDIHLGYGTDKQMLQQYVKRINAQEPDLILIGGDLIDNSVVPLHHEQMEEELSELKAPLGIYMVPGNHEYISGIDASTEFIRKTPILLLRDSVITLPNRIQLIGRDDRHNSRRQSLAELTAKLDPDKPMILLDHQPYELEKTEAAGIDLQFSGHTHRGQIWPISLITDQLFELSYGHLQKGNTHIYVSSGLSLWGPPFRIGTNSELVVFNITFK